MIFVFIDDSVERKWKDRKADSSANDDWKSWFIRWFEGNALVEANSTIYISRRTTSYSTPTTACLRWISYWWTNTTRVYDDQSNDVRGNSSTAFCEWTIKEEFSSGVRISSTKIEQTQARWKTRDTVDEIYFSALLHPYISILSSRSSEVLRLENEKLVYIRELFIDQQKLFDAVENDYSILGLEITSWVN